eukprot:7850818-Pyramimonas_sp.AAC.1
MAALSSRARRPPTRVPAGRLGSAAVSTLAVSVSRRRPAHSHSSAATALAVRPAGFSGFSPRWGTPAIFCRCATARHRRSSPTASAGVRSPPAASAASSRAARWRP